MTRESRRKIREGISAGIKKRIELGDFNSFLRLLRTKEIKVNFDVYSMIVCFSIENLEDLKNIRNMLRREFITWEDSLYAVDCWYSVSHDDYWVTFKWLGKHLPIRIDLETLYKELPEELKSLKEGCSFIETTTPIEAQGAKESKLLSYVCDTK